MSLRNFTLTTVELLSLLRALGAKTMLGLPLNPYEGVLVPPPPPLSELDQTLVWMLRICAECAASLVINHRKAGGEEVWQAWHRQPELSERVVQYTQLSPDSHRFHLLEYPEEILEIIDKHLPDRILPPCDTPITLSQQDILALRDTSLWPVEGLPHESPLRLALGENGHHIWLSSVHYASKQSYVASYLHSSGYIWLVEDVSEGTCFTPLNNRKLNAYVRGMVEAFISW